MPVSFVNINAKQFKPVSSAVHDEQLTRHQNDVRTHALTMSTETYLLPVYFRMRTACWFIWMKFCAVLFGEENGSATEKTDVGG